MARKKLSKKAPGKKAPGKKAPAKKAPAKKKAPGKKKAGVVARVKKAAKKVRARAATTREKARVRVANAMNDPAPPSEIESASAPPTTGKSDKPRGAARAGTAPRRRKQSPRVIGGVNLRI
jgi:hypothetical protein